MVHNYKVVYAMGVISYTIVALLWLTGCSLSPQGDAQLRAHDAIRADVGHGGMLQRALRYCVHCHGESLEGGDLGQPSCFQCHGRNWSLDAGRGAPADHTVDLGGYYHHPDYQSPASSCALSSCHESDLRGSDGSLTPARPNCLLCHEQLWP